MTCYVKDDAKLGRVIMCGKMGEPCKCGWVCSVLCDFPVGNGLTCDARCCENCSVNVGENLDYCKVHAAKWREFVEAGGVNLGNVIPIKVKE